MATLGVALTIIGALVLYWTWREPLRLPGSDTAATPRSSGGPS